MLPLKSATIDSDLSAVLALKTNQIKICVNENIKQPINNTEDTPVSQEAFSQLESNYSKDYYNQYRYPGSYVAPQPSIDSQAELLKNRQVLDEAIRKLEKKYDNIIKDIQNDIEEETLDEK